MASVYIVVGAESTGTRLMAEILQSTGCLCNHSEGWHWQQWDTETPNGQSPLVYHRSFPHGGIWYSLPDIESKFPEYDVQYVVMVRDWFAMARSQQRFQADDPLENAQRAYRMIFEGLRDNYILVTYEGLALNYEPYARFILRTLGLPDTSPLPPFIEGNSKYYG